MVPNIWIAAADNQVEVVEKYIDTNQFSANAKDPNGYTPIHAAASYGHLDLLKLLISKGGDINIQDAEGDTPLHHVEDVDTARYIIEQLNADFKIKNAEGQTAAEYIDDEGDYPHLAQYLRTLSHDQLDEIAGESVEHLPSPGTIDGHEIRYTMEEEVEEISPENRQKLQEIANSEDPESVLRQLVTSAVRDGLSQIRYDADEGVTKKKQK